MLKKVIALSLLAGLTLMTVSCFTPEDRHNRSHLRSFEGDWARIHETLDRHFFNYDWDDPYDN